MSRPWYLLGLSLATFILFVLVGTDNAFATALAYVIYGGYVAVLLKHVRGGTVVFDDLFEIVDKRWIYFAFLGVIKAVLIFLGFLCFIIPGIYLSVRWMFAEFLVIDKGLRPLEALQASSELTAGVRWKLFFFGLVGGLLVFLGLFALVIGAVVAALVVQLAAAKIYTDLSSPVIAQSTEEVGV